MFSANCFANNKEEKTLILHKPTIILSKKEVYRNVRTVLLRLLTRERRKEIVKTFFQRLSDSVKKQIWLKLTIKSTLMTNCWNS